MKNTSSFGDIQITPLSGQFDLRSPSGTLPITDFRLVLNASMNEFGKRCRRPGWRKYGAGSPRGFNNQDLHDRLDSMMAKCTVEDPHCTCPKTPSCVKLSDYAYGVILNNCVDGEDSDAPAWDGTLTRTDDCTWGFPYYNYSFGGKNFAAILALVSCDNNIKVYQLEIVVRLEDGTGLIVWKGTSNHTPVGTYTRTDGCDETATILLESCDACTQPVVTASPPTGSTITFGSFISLFATEGAVIFFTTDGSTPDNTSELYVSPFPITESMTVKAIAYSGDCISDVEVFEYTVLGAEDFLFEFTCDNEDQAGVFDEFEPNGSPDYNWRLSFTMPEIDVELIEIYETNSEGVWVTGQSWASKYQIYPAETGGPFSSYPVVIFEDGSRIASDYTPAVGNLVDNLAAGTHRWMMYGQPFAPLTGYFKLIFTYDDGTGTKKIYSVIPHTCEDYYGDGDDYGYDPGTGGDGICTETEFVTGFTIEGTPNNQTDILGMRFMVGGDDLTVTHLGRYVVSGNSGTHELTLREGTAPYDIVAQITVDTTLGLAGSYVYAELASPVILTAGGDYFLFSAEDAGGDVFLGDNAGDFNTVTSTFVATVNGAAVWGGVSPTVDEGGGFSYVPVNFKYCA